MICTLHTIQQSGFEQTSGKASKDYDAIQIDMWNVPEKHNYEALAKRVINVWQNL